MKTGKRGAGMAGEREPMWVAYRVLPFVALVFSVVLALILGSREAEYVGAVLGLSAAAVVWLATMRVSVLDKDAHKVKASIFYAVLLVFIGLLIFINGFFAVFGFSGYLFVVLVPGRWKALGMVANSGLMAMSESGGVQQLHGMGWIAYAGLFAVNIVIVGSITKAALEDDRRAEQRVRTIDELSEANRRLEQMMEENAGLHVQLVAQAREAGVFDERQRMAGEIHDTLAQGLTGIVAQLEAAELAENEPSRRRHLDLAKGLARDSLAEARRSVQALRPQMLESARLPEALGELAQQWTETSGIPVRAGIDGEARRLQPALEVVLFRAAQEALANVAKHSGADQVGMTLTYMHDQVSLDVLDNGRGFEPERRVPRPTAPADAGPAVCANGGRVARANGDGHANGTGYGLSAMSRRLRQVGGNLEIESALGDGTTVSASVPALWAE